MSRGLAEVVKKYLRAAHAVPLFRGAKRRSLCWTTVYIRLNTRPMHIGGKKWQGENWSTPRKSYPSATLFCYKLHMDFLGRQL